MLRTFAAWDTLGTYAFLATDDPWQLERAERIAREVLAEVDRTCSRFRIDSDLSRVNRRAGRWVRVDPLLVAAAAVALEAAADTDGLVDPCLGRVLVSLGYDADLDVVRRRRAAGVTRLPVRRRPDAWREVQVDPEGALLVPEGCALDLGATAKAWASDLRRGLPSSTSWAASVVVSLGGDVRVDGPAGVPSERLAGAGHRAPRATSERTETVHLGEGGLATSSTLARRWRSRRPGAPPRRRPPHRLAGRRGLAHGHRDRRPPAPRPTPPRPRHWSSAPGRRLAARAAASPPGWSAADGTVRHVGAWPGGTADAGGHSPHPEA